jgi:acetyltransferase-like isoleucine patch superfamily enzyme
MKQPKNAEAFSLPLVEKKHGILNILARKGLSRALNGLIFYSIANHFPSVELPLGGIGQWLRATLAKRMLRHCGKNIRIGPNVKIGSGEQISLGDNSNIGRASWILGKASIGDFVMMAPEGDHSFLEPRIQGSLNADDHSRPASRRPCYRL